MVLCSRYLELNCFVYDVMLMFFLAIFPNIGFIERHLRIWKAYKHRLFDKFSDSPVVFVVYSANAFTGGLTKDGDTAHVRQNTDTAADKQMLPGFEYMDPGICHGSLNSNLMLYHIINKPLTHISVPFM